MLAQPIVVGGDVGLAVARGDLVEHVEGTDALAGREILRGQSPLGELGDARGKALRRETEAGKVTWPGRDDGERLAALRDGGRRKGGPRDPSDRCALDKVATFQDCLPC